MAYTTIDDASAYFQTALYTGNGGTISITNDGNSDLKPDWVWVKNRTAYQHQSFDSSRGVHQKIHQSVTNAESTDTNTITAFNSDGFSLGSNVGGNQNSTAHVAWQWKANGGTTATNTTGNGIDAVIQASATSGFSIITYTGNGTQSGHTVGHGLGAVPKMIISKDRTNSSNVVSWRVYHEAVGNTKYMELQSHAAQSTFNDWDNTSPTSSVYSVGGAGGYTPTNTNNALYVAYVFADVQGYSKFGKYVGTGNRDGSPFIYTGFQPAFIMVKNTAAATGWAMFDNKRTIANGDMDYLAADRNDAESNAGFSHTDPVDFLSNGFKVMNSDAWMNTGGTKYIYMAFAEQPFVTSTGVPATAR